jgi:hypothetical protein
MPIAFEILPRLRGKAQDCHFLLVFSGLQIRSADPTNHGPRPTSRIEGFNRPSIQLGGQRVCPDQESGKISPARKKPVTNRDESPGSETICSVPLLGRPGCAAMLPGGCVS